MSSLAIPSKMQAILIKEQGDLDVMKLTEVDVPKAGKGEVVFKAEWAGVNFIDTYQRAGIYPLPCPRILGNESSGIVVEVGEGVEGFKIGDKVAAYTAGGSFAQYVCSPVSKTVVLPEGMGTRDAATVLLQGLTAVTFVKEAHEVKAGQNILIQAAAGGLGLLLVQLCKHYGATVIGTTSSPEKAALATAAGAHHVIIYAGKSSSEVAAEVFAITGGSGIDRGCHASFDGVGKDTFEMSIECLRRKGTMVSLGNASGAVPPFAPLKLGPKNLKVCRPVLNQYVHLPSEFAEYTAELFSIVQAGQLKLSVWKEYPLSTEGLISAQRDIMGRSTSGKLLIKIA